MRHSRSNEESGGGQGAGVRQASTDCASFNWPTCFLANSPRGGFTLIEMLTVVAILSVTSFLVVHIVIKSMELNRLAMGQLTQIITQGRLATRFRTDVAAASGRLDAVGEYVAGTRTLILDYSPGNSPPPSAPQVVWQWDGSRLWRTAFDEDSPARVVVAPEQRYQDVSFAIDEGDDATRIVAGLIPYVLSGNAAASRIKKREKRAVGIEIEAWLGAERR